MVTAQSRTHNYGLEYSAASAVLAVELLKGGLSLGFAWRGASQVLSSALHELDHDQSPQLKHQRTRIRNRSIIGYLIKQVFSGDCWKLSIPAILYVSPAATPTNAPAKEHPRVFSQSRHSADPAPLNPHLQNNSTGHPKQRKLTSTTF